MGTMSFTNFKSILFAAPYDKSMKHFSFRIETSKKGGRKEIDRFASLERVSIHFKTGYRRYRGDVIDKDYLGIFRVGWQKDSRYYGRFMEEC